MATVSIVLPCYNEANDIRTVLQNLEQQTLKDREIIVVDDGSTDGSVDIAQNLVDRDSLEDIRLIRGGHQGLTHARNVGIAQSKSDVVFFAECDCTYEPEYTERAVQALREHPEAAAVCMTGAPNKVRSTVATECIVIENKVQHKLLGQGKLKPFYAWVFRKDILIRLGGFDEKLFQGEDKDLFRRLTQAGYFVTWVPGIHWWHRRDQTLWNVAKKSVRRGQTRVLYLSKHHLVFETFKGVGPLWVFVLGLVLLPLEFYLGLILVVFVMAAVAVRSLRVIMIAWDVAPERKWFLVYPVFVLVRNFSAGMGYSIGLVRSMSPSGAAGTLDESFDSESTAG